jgi:hypothetical protein
VHEDEHKSSRKRGEERSSAGNTSTGQRANHYYEDSIKGGRLPEKPFLSDAHEKNEHEVDDDRAQTHLASR